MANDNVEWSKIKELVPGILRTNEKPKERDSHREQLKREELFYRVQQR